VAEGQPPDPDSTPADADEPAAMPPGPGEDHPAGPPRARGPEAVAEELEIAEIPASPVSEGPLHLRQERTRSILASAFVVLFSFVVGWTLVVEVDGWAQAKEFFEIVLPALTALLGSAVGFYFGAKSG
jgi:hypothetical protein